MTKDNQIVEYPSAEEARKVVEDVQTQREWENSRERINEFIAKSHAENLSPGERHSQIGKAREVERPDVPNQAARQNYKPR